MQITSFGTRAEITLTTAAQVIPNNMCDGQGLWLYNPSFNTEEAVFGLSSTATAVAHQIGELVPGESDFLPLGAYTGVPIYGFTRSGTAVITYGGVE